MIKHYSHSTNSYVQVSVCLSVCVLISVCLCI